MTDQSPTREELIERMKPCPFCGGSAHTQAGIYGYALWVGCGNQACRMKPSSQFHGEAEAIEAWNLRSDSQRIEELREALVDATAHLAAATSLLRNSPKTGAPSNRMFDQMLRDYEASLARAREALPALQTQGADNAAK